MVACVEPSMILRRIMTLQTPVVTWPPATRLLSSLSQQPRTCHSNLPGSPTEVFPGMESQGLPLRAHIMSSFSFLLSFYVSSPYQGTLGKRWNDKTGSWATADILPPLLLTMADVLILISNNIYRCGNRNSERFSDSFTTTEHVMRLSKTLLSLPWQHGLLLLKHCHLIDSRKNWGDFSQTWVSLAKRIYSRSLK